MVPAFFNDRFFDGRVAFIFLRDLCLHRHCDFLPVRDRLNIQIVIIAFCDGELGDNQDQDGRANNSD